MTRSFTALTITACLLIAGQVHATSPQPATPVSEQSPAAFELKGIAVGDDENATKPKLTAADRETLPEVKSAPRFAPQRQAERRVGKTWVRMYRSLWSLP